MILLPKSIKEKKIRFAIGVENALSEIWTISSRKDDIYVMCESMMGRIKLSIHGSGVCQLAFDNNYSKEILETPSVPFSDRTIQRWTRPPSPKHLPVHLTSVFFSAFERWPTERAIECPKATILIPPADHGYATEVAIFLSWSNPVLNCAPFEPEDILLAAFQINSGEYVTIMSRVGPLPEDYFEFRKVPWFLSVGAESEEDWDDARGISVVSFVGRSDQGVDFHSRHNKRMMNVQIETSIDDLNNEFQKNQE